MDITFGDSIDSAKPGPVPWLIDRYNQNNQFLSKGYLVEGFLV